MPRQARVQSPTDYYHVMMRGNNREKIFVNKDQKNYFLDCLKEQQESESIDIAAYCIMDNHIHIVVKSELPSLSKSVKKINIKYALKFNNRYDRIGHVFQDRYRSEIISDERYLLNVTRYIHNNPVKAKMAINPCDYKWSSYNDYIKTSTIISNKQKEFILGYFNKISQFVEFHNEIDNNEYLEIKEDIEENRLEIANRIISTYSKIHGINDSKNLSRNPKHTEELIKILLEKSKLSHRQISKILNVNNNLVHKINLLQN